MSHALTRYRAQRLGLLDLEAFARAADTHPKLVLRLVALGLLDADRDRTGGLWFTPAELARLARIQRLRAAFSVNYAALGLVLDLLDRVAELEHALRHGQRRPGGRPWTPRT
ncbi:chaperone modulator CbpM [Allokutzneria oryzae]|uniref:Chaperone modulator CbpM n=1 Tax=Allokutzneria oryzae TaxID=1378989 RepID=A0ABV5ZN33_9PSEU